MKKRILSLVLALSMMISLFPVSALAQPPGGGTAVLAEENGEMKGTTGSITINNSGVPVTDGLDIDSDGNYIGTNWKYDADGEGTLTLMSGTWNLANQNAVKCYVAIDEKATVAGGTFENTVWNEADGKISGGTFKKAVSNKGTITGGIFVGVDLENTSVINYDTGKITGGVFENNVTNGDSGDEEISASITGGLFKAKVQNKAASAAITGGVFVTIPTGSGTIANGYTLTTSGRTSKFLYAADGKEIDLGKSVYVIPNDTDALKVACDGVSNWDVADDSGTYALTNWDGVMLKPDGSFTLNPDKISGTTLTFTVSTTPVTPDPELVLADGVPDTSEEHAKKKTVGGKTIYYGDGWEYDGNTLKLNPVSEKEFTLNSDGVNITGAYLNCDLEIGENATAKGTIALTRKVINNGTIDKVRFGGDGEGHYPSLTNNGTVKNCSIALASVTNNGAMENVSFVTCSKLENSVGATIENAVVRKDSKSILYRNYGTMKKAVFDFSPSGEQKVRILKASRGENVAARLDGCEYAVFGTQLYVVGEPTLKIKINDADNTTITDVNSNVNYGGLKSDKDGNGYQQFTVQSGNGDIVLNQIGAPDPSEVKHTLTLNDAVIVNANGSTDTTGEYKEGTTVKIKPKIENQWKVFNGVWYTNPCAFSAIESNGDDTYTLTMPGYNLTVEACSVNRSYQLTVNGGTIEGAYSNIFAWGSQVRVTANAPKTGEHFAGWEAKKTGTDTTIALYGWSGNTIDLTKENLIFQMPTSNVTLTATYAKNPKYTLTVDGGYIGADKNQTSGNYEAGATIKLTAEDAADGKEFDKWALHGLTLVDGCQETNATIEVTITGNATAKATYKDKVPTTYTLTVDGGYIGDDETNISGKFEANAEIKVTAKAKTGYHFTKWTVKEGTLSLSEEELKANPLTFEMPDGAVSLKANYEEDTPDPVDPNPTPNPDDQPKTYTVTVKGGKINNKTEVKVEKGIKLTVDVDESEVPEGMTFDVWSIRFPEGKDTLTGDSSVMLHDPHMSFAMPEADITIEAQYRSSELPGEDDGPSTLGTMATVAVGGAAAGILVWQGVSLGVDSYLQLNLPKGVAVPANRRELVVLLWETAGKPEAALPSLYSDVPAEEIELQKATRWAIDNGLVKPADDSDASRFDPDRYVTKYDVFGAWLKLKKLMK